VNDPVRVGLVGYGYWGPNLGRNIDAAVDVEWIAAADGSESRREQIKIRYPTVRVYANLEEMANHEALSAVIIATPARTHAPLVSTALHAGLDVFVEKPLALTVDDALDVCTLADNLDRVLMVGHTFEYNPAVLELKRLIESGHLGSLLYMHSQRINLGRFQNDINAMWSIAPHDVSISNFLIDSEPEWVCARGACLLTDHIEDVVFASIGYGDSIISHVHASWLDPSKIRRTTVVGKDRMAVFDDIDSEARLKIYDKKAESTQATPGGYGEYQFRVRSGDIWIPQIPLSEPVALELHHFIQCVRDRSRPRTDGWNGARVVAVLEAAQASLASGGREVAVARLTKS
jgi:predicted dehydrogenase